MNGFVVNSRQEHLDVRRLFDVQLLNQLVINKADI